MKLIEKLGTKTFQLRVKQHRAVLDFVTDMQEAMLRSDMSQQALATALNKSRSWVSKVFRKKPNLTFFTAVEMADAVGLDVTVSLVERGAGEKRAGAPTFEVVGNVHFLPFAFPAHAPPGPVDDIPALQEAVG